MASAGERFRADLLQVVRSEPRMRAAVLAVLAKWAGCSVYLPVQRANERRALVARDLLQAGREPAEVALILAQRFGVTQRTGQADVRSAQCVEP